ncbi:MAG: Amuc_1102 family pilus-like protein [Luteolibacter sp.]
MNIFPRFSVSLAASAILAMVSMTSANGQAAKVVGEKPAFDDLPSPEFSGGKQKSFKPKDWLEIEAKLKISLAPEPPSKTCEKVTVKWYVAVKNPDKPGTFLLLTKEVNHVNVPLDDDQIFFSIYLSPASVKRLTGSDKGGKQAVEFVGYEVLVNGEKKAEETNKGKPGWWNAASDKISRSESVPLLTKAETPFANMWWDRYAEVSAERR